MERKNYLKEELSREEKAYLMRIIVNVRKKYIRDNYDYINRTDINWDSCADMESESLFETVLNNCVNELKSAIEFEKLFSDEKLYNIAKALSKKEKMVLFSLYKENKSVNQTAIDMKLSRSTIWRIKNEAQEKIMKKLLGGNKNV